MKDIQYPLLIFMIVCFVRCVRIVPQRMLITEINNKYVENASAHFLEGPRGEYIVNMRFANKHTWTNNVSLHVVYFEYSNNEYRRSFVEMHYRLCSMLRSDAYVGRPLQLAGLACPVAPGLHTISNITIPSQAYPTNMPFKRARLEMLAALTGSNRPLMRGHVYLAFVKTNHTNQP